MSNKFLSEREGQIKFFADLKISADIELTHNTDGVYRGTLFEFKLTISDINKVLFQAIKYLSHRRIKGEPTPAQILLVALNEEIAYLFNSGDFLKHIEEIYAGAASKNNSDFNTKKQPEKIDYSKPEGLKRVLEILSVQRYTKINIDVFDVVGWADNLYTSNPKASKSKFFDELRSPKLFKEYIYPWKGKDVDFKYIMDLLNDKQHKKELGAFYTPKLYCRKATELVRRAIKQLPKGHDYIILDRTAGTGNLEEFLTDKPVKNITIGELDRYIDNDLKKAYLKDKAEIISMFYSKKNLYDITIGELEKQKSKMNLCDYLSENEIGHTVVNTYELKEWIVLNERFGDKVKLIIPPFKQVDSKKALVNGGDALSDHFVLGSKARKKSINKEYLAIIDELNGYVADKKTNIILLENPPYSDVGAIKNNSATATNRTAWKNSFVCEELRQWIRENKSVSSRASNDLANLFIWSGFQYYLHKPDDSYILFSPPKYIKSQHLISKEMAEGYIFNRAYFHANSASAISCISWKNHDKPAKNYELEILDIEDDELRSLGNMVIKKVYNNLSAFYDKYDVAHYPDDKPGVILEWNGEESKRKFAHLKPIYNDSIVGYLVAQDFGFEHPRLSTNLVRTLVYAEHGFYLRKDNYLEKLPLFAAGKYEFGKKWWENGTVFKCSDGGGSYTKDKNFLKSCLIFTCLSYFNKCRSFDGSDKRFYKNELCFDKGTLANEKLKKDYKLTKDEKDLLDIFSSVLDKAKKTKNYNKKYTYGTYQIDDELNTRYKNENDEWIYDYPELNTAINSLKTKLAKYYEAVIQPKLFEYELLK